MIHNLKNKSISILVVEDNQLDALIVKTLLQNHFNLEVVSTGQEALEIIELMTFDIILMDINLGHGNMDGTTVMKLIKQSEKHKHIKVFAVTAYAENESVFVNEGFDGLYVKPVIKEDIFEFLSSKIK